jgi:3-oxoacyl-[acyl-carrier-protein] synthase III
MTEVFLARVGFALGEIRETVEEAAAAGLLSSDAAALSEAGFRFHNRCSPEETAYDLARRAAGEITESAGAIDVVLYATCLPANGNLGSDAEFQATRDVKTIMDFPASHLQADLELDAASVIGLNQQACTGLLGALRVGRALLTAEAETKQALCVTADRFPEGALYSQSYNLISDGAAACILSRSGGDYRFLATHARTSGALARATDEEAAGSFFVHVNRLIQETLARAGLTIGDVDWFVAQNMNRKALEILARLLPLDPARVVAPTLPEIGHVISGDNLINLKCLTDRGAIRKGEKVLLAMAGYGLNWQCAILEKT